MSLNPSYSSKKRLRLRFGKIPREIPVPDLLEIQKRSYVDFLQPDCNEGVREPKGLESIFRSIFPLSDYDRRVTVEYVGYILESPKYDVSESIQREVSYAAPIRLKMRLLIWEDGDVRSIKEQEVYMGSIPLMASNGTFVINGAQRVIVSQLHRAPGVFYYSDYNKSSGAEKAVYSARVIPYKGSWLDFELDPKDVIYFHIDKKKKLYATTLLRALGYDHNQMLSMFYDVYTCYKKGDKWVAKLKLEYFKGSRLQRDIVDADTGEVIMQSGTRITQRVINTFNANKSKGKKEKLYVLTPEDIIGRFIANDILHENALLFSAGAEVTSEMFEKALNLGLSEIPLLYIDYINVGPYIRNTLALDDNDTREKALLDIYKALRPGDIPTLEGAERLLHSSFFDPARYNLSNVGRMKINLRHSLDVPEDFTQLRPEDIVIFMKHLIHIRDTNGPVDDIDSLGNRRVRSVGELLEVHLRTVFVPRTMQGVLNKLNAAADHDSIMIHDLMNSKNLMSVVNEFFAFSQLSQFMNQTNPIAELTHKRRVSALGPGGLTRDRAGSSVRDVHYTHYGRICPIETPEGQNIGLIGALATYARINKYGFVETPCRKIVDKKITDEVVYISAIEEPNCIIAQADAKISDDGFLATDVVSCRKGGDFILIPSEEVTHIDISPKQIVSVAASLIPFLGHNDAARALMGANMQRQALPLLSPKRAVIGTGMEAHIARDSESVIIAKKSGIVVRVDANNIVVQSDDDDLREVEIYPLVKYQKSNRSTCINQRPIVSVGDRVKKGDIIADGSCTDLGELALGKDVLVAFMPWDGYNFEDAIIISENLIRESVFTSLHIMKYQCIVRDTRLGDERTTRDIPNVSSDLSSLDEDGIVHIGRFVKEGDILVGKTTPIAEVPLTPEEKLLKAIFGETGANVKDSSLRVPHGVSGVVTEVHIFTRRGVEKDDRTVAIESMQVQKVMKEMRERLDIIQEFVRDEYIGLLANQPVEALSDFNIKSGALLTKEMLLSLPFDAILKIKAKDQKISDSINNLKSYYVRMRDEFNDLVKKKIEKIESGDDLPSGVLKIINVYIVTKLPLQNGDKMAGRYGNKGVVSITAPVADMPFLPDGRVIDVILNPLGVVSRMNVGQIFETHLGLAAVSLGQQINSLLESFRKDRTKEKMDQLRKRLLEIYTVKGAAGQEEILSLLRKMTDEDIETYIATLKDGVAVTTPVFDDASEEDINNMLKKASLPTTGQMRLIDGRTGEYFDREVTVGYMHLLKLHHLVDEKIHARSIGTYSLITQQPLGGKAQFGAQRFGEMEVWALEAYGASYLALEMMTVKSDDVFGRTEIYRNILNGNMHLKTGIPESFKVVEKEMKSLALNVEIISF